MRPTLFNMIMFVVAWCAIVFGIVMILRGVVGA